MKIDIINDEMIARYFAGDLNDKEIEMIENTLMNDKTKEQEMKDFARLWEKSAGLGKFDKIDTESDWQSVKARMGFRQAQKISFWKYFPRIAAVLVVAVGLTYFFTRLIERVPNGSSNEYVQLTSQENTKTVILPDNTQITLNKNSRIVYNSTFGTSNRDVILEGEAFFEVAKNKDLPFRVYSGNSTVEVLGTSFNVKPFKQELIVSVLTGHVLFYETSKKDNKVELLANEQSVYDLKTNRFQVKSDVDPNMMAWKTGILVYNGESLEQFFNTFAIIYNLELENRMKKPFKETINPISFSNITAEQILTNMDDAIEQEFKAEIKDGKLILSD